MGAQLNWMSICLEDLSPGLLQLGTAFFSAQLLPNHSIKMTGDNFITVIASNLFKLPLLSEVCAEADQLLQFG